MRIIVLTDKIYGGNGNDIIDIAKCMMLDDEEKKYIDLLDVGHAIIKLKSRMYKPVLVLFPMVPLVKGYISDDLLKNKEYQDRVSPWGCEHGFNN